MPQTPKHPGQNLHADAAASAPASSERTSRRSQAMLVPTAPASTAELAAGHDGGHDHEPLNSTSIATVVGGLDAKRSRVARKPERKPAASKGSDRDADESGSDTEESAELGAESPDGPDDEAGDEGGLDRDIDDASTAEFDDTDGDVDLDSDGDGPSAPGVSRSLVRDSGRGLERFDPMTAYLREVQRHPLLSPEETQSLATRFVTTQDPAIAARLVTSNLRLVVKIAYEYRRAYKNMMDLVQEGNIGLMQAVKRYDPYRGVKLSSYAAWWIRAYILRFILNNWRLVKLGTTQAQRKLFFNLRKKRAELVAMGIDPTHAEIAKHLNVPESDVAEMDVRLAQSENSLDAPVGDSDGRSIARVDLMPSVSAGPETQLAENEVQSLVRDKLKDFRLTLAGKEKDLAIFDLRLVAEDPLTLQDLGDRFGVSRERVRQLEQRLLGRLRDFLKREMTDAQASVQDT